MNGKPDQKCVIILAEGLPPGFAANASAVLAITIGMKNPEIVAEDLQDGSGIFHAGLVNIPVPLLQASPTDLKNLRDLAGENKEVLVIDFSEPARKARTFEAYRELLALTSNEDLSYVGIALLGPKKLISSMTSSFRLFA